MAKIASPDFDKALKIFSEIISDLVCILDSSGMILDVNQKILDQFGYLKSEVISRSYLDFVGASSREVVLDGFAEMKRKGICPLVELELVRKDGSLFTGVCIGAAIPDDRYLVTIQDISSMKDAMPKAKENEHLLRLQYDKLETAYAHLSLVEEKYRNLYEYSPDLLRTIDNNGIIIDCNNTYAKSLGYSKEDTIGRSIFDHVAEKSIEELHESIKEWQQTGRVVNREIWLKRKDGKIFPALLSGTSLHDKDDIVTGRTVSLRDITEIYNARKIINEKESDLRERYEELRSAYQLVSDVEHKYRYLYDSSPILYCTVDTNGVIQDCNKSYAKALGYSKEDIIKRLFFDHVAKQSYDDIKKTFQQWKAQDSVVERLIWFERKDGTIFPTMLSASSIYNRDGELVGSNTAIRDISDVYSARKQADEEEKKRLTAIGEISARIAHDLRNPLSVIKNAIYLIKMENPNPDGKTLQRFAFIDDSITRMGHQIDEVLDFVRPKPLQIIRCTTKGLLQNAVDRMNIPNTVKVNMSEDDIDVICDPTKIEIVFVNLLSNAIQAMSNSGTITLRSYEEKESVVFEVEDTGPGIPQELLPKIFDPLFTTRQIGTGLGLTSCKNIVEKHGGTIKVRTVPGKGTTFVIAIPKNP